jgi:hypothetical protein
LGEVLAETVFPWVLQVVLVVVVVEALLAELELPIRALLVVMVGHLRAIVRAAAAVAVLAGLEKLLQELFQDVRETAVWV